MTTRQTVILRSAALLGAGLLWGMGGMSITLAENSETSRVRELMEMVLDKDIRKSDPDKLASALLELEILKPKSPSVIQALISLLDFEKPPHPTFQRDPRYPAIGALATIGEASLPGLVEVLKNSDPDSLRSRNAVQTFLGIFRDELREGVAILEIEAWFSAGIGAERLKKVADQFRQIDQKLSESNRR